ncbi:MAG: hypothetical protein E6Q72_01960 [Pseudomonas sp.]|nr:MAG: hypothetical protein E6Q72_01960 [Pseudomonas sp.]
MAEFIQYDPTRHGDMPEIWRSEGKPAATVLRIAYEDSIGSPVERVIDTQLFADLAFGPTILAHCHLRDALREFRIDRIRSCFDETLQQPVADVYEHLQNLYRATPEHALECLLEEHLDSLRILLYLLEAGGQTIQTIGTLLGEAGQRLGGDTRISEQAITGRLEDYFGASEEQYRAWVLRLCRRTGLPARQQALALIEEMLQRAPSSGAAQREAFDYLFSRAASQV